MRITEKENNMLIAIRDSEYRDGGPIVGVPVWVDCLRHNGILFGTSSGGIMASLVKKKLVSHGMEDCVELTQLGFDSIK